jgi:hypothetical protein
MPTLEELLRASLKGANDKYNQANKALHAAVVETAKAVEAATEGKATIRLDEVQRNASETRYDLVIVIKKDDESRTIAIFEVGMKGFPITRYEDSEYQGHPAFRVMEKFETAEAIAKYFQKLASDPDSPLVGYLAYIMRNLGDDGDPIPF